MEPDAEIEIHGRTDGDAFLRSVELMRILITGSTGRLGGATATRLQESADVRGLDVRPGPFTSVFGDIADRRALRSAVEGAECIVHTAALHAPHVGKVDEAEFHRVNVEGTAVLLEEAKKEGVRRFVFTSTTSVYGCTTRLKNGAVWVTEDLPPHPEDIYDTTKLAGEDLCRRASTEHMKCVVLRVSRCFPEPAHLMAFYRLYRGADERDVAEAHRLAATKPLAVPFETLNVSALSPFTREDCPGLLADPWSVIERHHPGARRHFLDRGWPLPKSIDRVYVVERARALLGFVPRYNFPEVLQG